MIAVLLGLSSPFQYRIPNRIMPCIATYPIATMDIRGQVESSHHTACGHSFGSVSWKSQARKAHMMVCSTNHWPAGLRAVRALAASDKSAIFDYCPLDRYAAVWAVGGLESYEPTTVVTIAPSWEGRRIILFIGEHGREEDSTTKCTKSP